MASVKKARPSSENGMPMMGPACRMKVGQSSPSSKESTVPDTAPTDGSEKWRSNFSIVPARNTVSASIAIRSGCLASPIAVFRAAAFPLRARW